MPGNVNDLKEALLEEWNKTPQSQINNLIYSMRRRCQAVRNVRGGHTCYERKKKSTPTSNETEISNEINDFQTVHEL